MGAGVTWGEFDRATQEHGLATTGGRVSTTGVAGLTLGGGSGWLERSYGLTCDSLRVGRPGDGRRAPVTASATENPDLFWALHGGGGNFGIATSFEFDLHPLGPQVLAGLMLWPGEAGRELTVAYRDFMEAAPDALGGALVLLTGPPEEFVPDHLQGTTVRRRRGAVGGGGGRRDRGDRATAGSAAGGRPGRPDAYADFQCMIDDPPGFRQYWSGEYLDSLPDDALEVFVKYGADRPSPISQQLLAPWGGAVGRVPDEATPTGPPVRPLDHAPVRHLGARRTTTEANIAWVRAFRDDIARFTNGGVYLNFIGMEGQDRIRAAFGDEKYRRLARIKRDFDPSNVFRGNQNIEPAPA